MKKVYQTPELEISLFHAEDVIVTSYNATASVNADGWSEFSWGGIETP